MAVKRAIDSLVGHDDKDDTGEVGRVGEHHAFARECRDAYWQ